MMNWNAFWSGLLGTTIPATLVSILMLYLNHRTRRAIEKFKSESARELSDHKLWHDKRIASLVAIHEAFRRYLDWLRRSLYVRPLKGLDVTPMHDFRDAIQEQLVYLNDDLRDTVLKYEYELLQFWNWTVALRSDPESWNQVQKRLDYEIPHYLELLRQRINAYADPNYPKGIRKISLNDEGTQSQESVIDNGKL
jgi:hypothetical protein